MNYTEYKGGKRDGQFWHAHFTHNDTLLTVRPHTTGKDVYVANVVHGVYALADYCMGRIPSDSISTVWEGGADSFDTAIEMVWDAYHKGTINQQGA